MEKKKGGKGIDEGDILLASTLARQVQTNIGHVTFTVVLYAVLTETHCCYACIKWYESMHHDPLYILAGVRVLQ